MKTMTVTWALPVTRESGGPLLPADIQHTRVEMRVVGAPTFTVMGSVLPGDVQTFTITDVDVGDWELRLVVVDTAGRESAPVDTPFNVPDESAPSGVTDVVITLAP